MPRYDAEDFEPDQTIPGTNAIHPIPRPQKPHLLVQIRGPGAPNTFILDKDKMLVGRLSTVDVHVPSAELSRKHLSLTKLSAEIQCEDLNSRNGVFLNGVKIHSATLREGDQLQLGDVVFIYHEGR